LEQVRLDQHFEMGNNEEDQEELLAMVKELLVERHMEQFVDHYKQHQKQSLDLVVAFLVVGPFLEVVAFLEVDPFLVVVAFLVVDQRMKFLDSLQLLQNYFLEL
jgi:hypothetical protein